MKFSVSSSALLSLLATTGKVISNKNTLPILDYFLMELNGNELKVTTSDLETTLIGSITVDSVESEGTIAAPAKLMLDSLKEFSELPLTIDVNDKNGGRYEPQRNHPYRQGFRISHPVCSGAVSENYLRAHRACAGGHRR